MNNPQIVIEGLIAIAVVVIQLFFFFSTSRKIKKLLVHLPAQKLTSNNLDATETEHGVVQLIKEDNTLFSDGFKEAIESINKYLIKNEGTTDFSIIKSIVERNIENKETEVSSNVTLPLYIGLMGTFIGIIIGLFKIGFLGGVSEENINLFIGGVVIAMIASFFGLLLTVFNNSKNFTHAKAVCDQNKNKFYDFLQSDLLPHLGNSLYDALDRLKVNINDFNKKFASNIELFDTKFSDNISSLGESVQSLSGNIGAVVENTKTQKEFLVELKKIGYNRLAEANMKVFTIIRDTVPTLVEFVDKQKDLTQLMEKTSVFVSTIDNILNRVKSFEDSINALGENINTKQYLGNEVLKRIDANLNYLDKNFEVLKHFEDSTAGEIEQYFKGKYLEIQKLTHNIKLEVESAFDLKIENNPFQKLLLLDPVGKNLEEIKEKLNFSSQFNEIKELLIATKKELHEVGGQILKGLKSRHDESKEEDLERKPDNTVRESETPKRKGKRSVWKGFTNLFKRNRGRKT